MALAVGSLVIFYPLSGVLSLTLLVATFLLIGGILKTILAFRLRPNLLWKWLLFAGGLAVALGLVILAQWPFAAGWVLGVLVGVDLLSSGWWMLAIAARRGEQAGEQQPGLMEANAQRANRGKQAQAVRRRPSPASEHRSRGARRCPVHYSAGAD